MAADIALLYVARGDAGGLDAARGFVAALREHSAGVQYRLVFLAKGWGDAGQRRALDAMACNAAAELLDLPDDGFDWGAYFRALPHVAEPWLCLLNSHSRPQVSGWLDLLLAAAGQPGVGLAGATASWESPRWTLVHERPIWGRLRGAASWLRHGAYLTRFPPFPNAHVRSSGLVLSRALFANFADARSVPASKAEAHVLEGGHMGLSSFARGRGLATVVVDNTGQARPPALWPAAQTFRIGTQAGLLIADNRTRDYDNASPRQRRGLEYRSWGCHEGRARAAQQL